MSPLNRLFYLSDASTKKFLFTFFVLTFFCLVKVRRPKNFVIKFTPFFIDLVIFYFDWFRNCLTLLLLLLFKKLRFKYLKTEHCLFGMLGYQSKNKSFFHVTWKCNQIIRLSQIWSTLYSFATWATGRVRLDTTGLDKRWSWA